MMQSLAYKAIEERKTQPTWTTTTWNLEVIKQNLQKQSRQEEINEVI
jgi:hypothetical protein